MMDVAPLPTVPSPSKRRRLRALETKSKLYKRAYESDTMSGVASQLAMLTASIDGLISMLSCNVAGYQANPSWGTHQDSGSKWNPNAEIFTPSQVGKATQDGGGSGIKDSANKKEELPAEKGGHCNALNGELDGDSYDEGCCPCCECPFGTDEEYQNGICQARQASNARNDVEPPAKEGVQGNALTNQGSQGELQSSSSDAFPTDEQENITLCKNCGESKQECFCWQILCCSCLKSAAECVCRVPLLRKYSCRGCGSQSSKVPSLAKRLALPLTTNFTCQACNDMLLPNGEWFFLEESEHVCGSCRRYDGQDCLRWCDGKDCPSEDMFHTYCMESALFLSQSDQKYRCWFCRNAERPIDEGSEWETSSFDVASTEDCVEARVGGGRHNEELDVNDSEHEHAQTEAETSNSCDPAFRTEVALVVEQRQILQSRLDYMVRYCEKAREVGSRDGMKRQDAILQYVREASNLE